MTANARAVLSVGTRQHGPRILRVAGQVFVAICGILMLAVHGLRLQVVDTESVPVGLYARSPLAERPIERGQYVCFEGGRAAAPALFREAVERGAVPVAWARSERLTKRVAAIAGDRVDYVAEHVTVNGVPLAASTIVPKTGRGVALPRPRYPLVLGRDEVWLSSEHARGFDSRYFGPVHREALSCRAELVWRW